MIQVFAKFPQQTVLLCHPCFLIGSGTKLEVEKVPGTLMQEVLGLMEPAKRDLSGVHFFPSAYLNFISHHCKLEAAQKAGGLNASLMEEVLFQCERGFLISRLFHSSSKHTCRWLHNLLFCLLQEATHWKSMFLLIPLFSSPEYISHALTLTFLLWFWSCPGPSDAGPQLPPSECACPQAVPRPVPWLVGSVLLSELAGPSPAKQRHYRTGPHTSSAPVLASLFNSKI